jgi:hypothetical protein
MIGQWIGKYRGDVEGDVMINIDSVDEHFECVAYINPSNSNIPSSVAYLETENNRAEQVTVARINPVDPRNGNQCQWDDIKSLFPEGVQHSSSATVSLKVENDVLQINAESNIGVILNCALSKPSLNVKTKIKGRALSWKDFKEYVSDLSKSKYLYRGQKEPWRLQTSFHRRGRYRISEFISKDVKQLHQRLSAITSHYFDLNVPEQNGSFFNLLQHHGYPTPLLDWSYSPFVSAFFAFRDIPQNFNGEGNARIYIFNNVEWQKNYPQMQNIDPSHPHLSIMEFIAIANPRLVPQQSITTVSNIVDIEAYVLEKSERDKTDYLWAIDIPANERENVMKDLRFMGITAGSMFPSIDGVCEELRELNF